jgi:hypothetical protein
VKTTRANLEHHKLGISETSLPQTIRDAISVTRELGIRFLWVDALCIVQDSLHGEDWHAEASKMRDVYSNALVTISAESTKDARSGFLSHRSSEPTNRCFKLPYLLVNGDQCGSVYLQQVPVPSYYYSYLSYRAWAFQERGLSMRVLEYRHDMISLTCRTGMIAEPSSKIQERVGEIYQEGSRPLSLSVPIFRGEEEYYKVFLE